MYIALPWLKSKHFDKYFVHVIYAESLCVDLERQTKENKMGRPLHKKLFGNRNIGTNGSSDNNIGGEGVASVTIGTVGSYTSALPTVSFSTPQIPGGVQTTGTVHGKALSAVATAAGTGYDLAQVLTQTGGGTGTMATFSVSAVKVVSISLNNGGSAVDVNDEYTFASNGFSFRVRVTAANAGVATAVSLVSSGDWTTGALPTNTTGMTRTQVAAGQDWNGTGLQVNITGWGVSTVAVATEGDYTAISNGAQATSVAPAGGTGATLTITYGVKSVAITQKGSGYTNVADAAPTFSAGAATGTSVLTTDSGATNNNDNASTNQENAIVATAQLAGGSDTTVDIISQKGARRFKVTDGTRTGVCELTASGSLSNGQMSIIATDARGNTYYVTKLTAKKATLAQKEWVDNGDWVFNDGGVAQWGFSIASGAIVQVANA